MLKVKNKSKPISELKKGDKIIVDSHPLEVDSHYVFIKHKDTTEMIIELFNPKTDKEYQLRYFDDQIESSLEFYYLQNEFQYVKAETVKEVAW